MRKASSIFPLLLCVSGGAAGFVGACTDVPAETDAALGPSGTGDMSALPPVVGDGGVQSGDRNLGPGPTPNGGGGPNGGGAVGPPCLPAQEVCDAIDNDCNGQVDEVGCACTDQSVCYAGPAQTRGVGTCTDGTRACDDRGEFFGPCSGSVGPTEDRCDGLDNDCDGEVDEACCQYQDCDDASMPGPGPGPGGPDMGCLPGDPGCLPPGSVESFVVGERVEHVPIDYVMVIDNSGSMDDTVAQVEANLGNFATRLASAGFDYHFVLVAEQGTDPEEPDVCVPPPMAGANCGNTDRFLHLDQHIGSNDAFEHTLACVEDCDDGGGSFRNFLRPDARLQVLVVTDDESDMSFGEFQQEMTARALPAFTLHGVVGLRDDECVADVGNEYIAGAQATGGELLHICDQDWGQVIQVLFDNTLVQIEAVYPLAGRPDPATIRVFVTPPGGAELEAIGTWDYDALGNAIVFRDGAVPLTGSQITVRYQAL